MQDPKFDDAALAANARDRTLGGWFRGVFEDVRDFFGMILGGIWSAIAGVGRGIAWVWNTFWDGVFDAWDFFLKNLPVGIAIGSAMAIAAFEWPNAARGWAAQFPGMETWMIWAGAAGVIGGFIWLWRRAREAARDEDKGGAESKGFMGNAILAAVAFMLCLFGVWSSTASNAVEKSREAVDSRAEYAQLVQDLADLRNKLEVSNVAFFEQEIAERNRMIESLIATAEGGYGLADLDVETCRQDLKIGARRLCNRVNGGVDPFTNEETIGERNLITRLENAMEQAKADEAALTDLELAVKNYRIKKGDELQTAMGNLVGEDQQFFIQSLFYVFFSGGLLIISAYLWDWSLETIEQKRIVARTKKGKSV